MGTFDNLERYFKVFKINGPAQGYYPDSTKGILVVHLKNPEVRELFFQRHGFKMYIGARYLGGYIGDDVYKGDWLQNITKRWERDICALRKRRINILRGFTL